jgi:hypothetical protein
MVERIKFNPTYEVKSKEDFDYLSGRLELISRHCIYRGDREEPFEVRVKRFGLNGTNLEITVGYHITFKYCSRAVDAAPAESPIDISVESYSECLDRVEIKETSDVDKQKEDSSGILDSHNPESKLTQKINNASDYEINFVINRR